MLSSENPTLVKILDTISLIFRFLSISFLIRSLELIAFSPLGYQLLCWVTCPVYIQALFGGTIMLDILIIIDGQSPIVGFAKHKRGVPNRVIWA